MSRLRALLATLRIANAPSVVSNVWLGYMLGRFYWETNDLNCSYYHAGTAVPPFAPLGLLALSSLALYFAGNLANDWFDRNWDMSRRPERALPSGQFNPTSFLAGSISLGLAGGCVAAILGPQCLLTAVTIILLIAIYTRFHKSARWAIVPMGMCRACLYFMGFLAAWPTRWFDLDGLPASPSIGYQLESATKPILILLPHALALFSYIVGLSLAARYESLESPPRAMTLLARSLVVVPLAVLASFWISFNPLDGAVGLVPVAIWLLLTFTVFHRPIPRFVSALLAGIPLVDFVAAYPLAMNFRSFETTAIGQPVLIATVSVPLIAFILGRLLQKVAPAT